MELNQNMIKILPISNCKECPKLDEENLSCKLSEARAYDLDEDWAEYLEQFCPLENLDGIINEAYEKGKEYSTFKEHKKKEIQDTVKENKWATAHEYLEKI